MNILQDMACDTFIKIALKCRRQFVQVQVTWSSSATEPLLLSCGWKVSSCSVQVGEVMPFIDELLGGINSIICDLQPQQVQTFYEAVGHMISARWLLCIIHKLISSRMTSYLRI